MNGADMTSTTAPERDVPPVSLARSMAGAAVTLVPPVVVAWSARAWEDRLPDPLPTHWSDLSAPDGFSSYASTWQTVLVIAVVGAALGLTGLVLSRTAPLYERATTGLGAASGYFALGLWLAMARAAWDRADAHGSPLGWGVALPVVAGLLAVPLVLMVLGRRPRTHHTLRLVDEAAASSSGLVLAPGERAVWTHRIFMVWPLAVATTMAVVGAVLGFVAGGAQAALLALLALPVGALSWVQVTVDERGLRIGIGPWGWTVKKVPLVAIAEAAAESIAAVDWGGWGYRILPGRSALVLRSGPAIVLQLADGRRFAVTVDGPQVAVALLQAVRVRANA
jgi:hypothetical protein